MDFKGLLRRAAGAGLRQGARYLSRQLQDPTTMAKVTELLGDPSDTRTLRDGTMTGQGSRSTGAARSTQCRRAGTASAERSTEYDSSRSTSRTTPRQRFPKRPDGGYPGDYTGPIRPVYKPDLDGDADPGEVVWGWVPFEEDHSKGKDRPVLIIGRDGKWLLSLMLTSKDNVPGGVGDVHEDEHGSHYMNVGSGEWDRQGRDSEVRLDRIIRIGQQDVRREGAVMPMDRFSKIVDSISV